MDNVRSLADAAGCHEHTPAAAAGADEGRMRSRHLDVLVVGAGMAGLSAGTSARRADPGLSVGIAAPSPMYSGGCSWETHAFNAPVRADDSWEQHLDDTLLAGGGINDPALAEVMCKKAAALVAFLEDAGITFDASASGEHDLGTYGGSSVSRGLHSSDTTGLQIMQRLIVDALHGGCELLRDRWLVELVVQDGRCCGGVFMNSATGKLETITADTVILATGGGACMYPISSISADKRASGIAIALRNGLPAVDLEMVQFHPTGLVAPGTPGHGTLLEEELRTRGATLVNARGERFMYRYDQRGERATRDIVARGMMIEIAEGRGTADGGVYLDLTGFEPGLMLERFPNSVRRLRDCNVDLERAERVEVSPTAHFLMGGTVIDETGKTELPGLLACGEDAGGIHGANRVGGNGVADALVFGRVAGGTAAAEPRRGRPDLSTTTAIPYIGAPAEVLEAADTIIKDIMWVGAGLLRDAASLARAAQELHALRVELTPFEQTLAVSHAAAVSAPKGFVDGLALMHELEVAEGIVAAASARPASLGAHYRTDAEPGQRDVPFSLVIRRTAGNAFVTARVARPGAPALPGTVADVQAA